MNQDIVPTHRAPRTSASDYVRGDQVQLWPSRMPSSSLDRCRGTCGARRPIMTTRSDPKRSDRSRWPRATPLDPPYAKKKTVIPGSFHDGHRASIASSRGHASILDPPGCIFPRSQSRKADVPLPRIRSDQRRVLVWLSRSLPADDVYSTSRPVTSAAAIARAATSASVTHSAPSRRRCSAAGVQIATMLNNSYSLSSREIV